MVNTTHLMVLQEVFNSSDVFENANDDFEISRTKCHRLEYKSTEFPNPVTNKSPEPPKFSEIKHSAYVSAKFNSPFFIWFCFRNGIHKIKMSPH